MRIHTIDTGFFSTDGGAMFGILPKRIWAKNYSVDSENRCPMTMRVVFADLGTHKVLFDAGLGNPRLTGMGAYKFHGLKSLSDELTLLGCKTEELTDVVLSHLHFDHCGGLVTMAEAGNLRPTFPNARYWVSMSQWELARNPTRWEADSFDPAVLSVIEATGKLNLLEVDTVLFPGVRVELYQGHTQGQLVSWIGSEPMESYVFAGDVIPMLPHLNLLCIAAVDNCASNSVDEKSRLLNQCCQNNAKLFFYHDVAIQSVILKEKNGRISVKEIFNS